MAEKPDQFEKRVKEGMGEVVKTHQHNHPLYKPTHLTDCIIDSQNKRAAFVLFEQIDTDRCTPEGEGWLGDQYRYSVWYVEGDKEPRRLYEDHSYIRKTVSALTGSRGRDPRIDLEELKDDGVIARVSKSDAEGLSQNRVKITLEGKIE
jgi:hypothetical protein